MTWYCSNNGDNGLRSLRQKKHTEKAKTVQVRQPDGSRQAPTWPVCYCCTKSLLVCKAWLQITDTCISQTNILSSGAVRKQGVKAGDKGKSACPPSSRTSSPAPTEKGWQGCVHACSLHGHMDLHTHVYTSHSHTNANPLFTKENMLGKWLSDSACLA